MTSVLKWEDDPELVVEELEADLDVLDEEYSLPRWAYIDDEWNRYTIDRIWIINKLKKAREHLEEMIERNSVV